MSSRRVVFVFISAHTYHCAKGGPTESVGIEKVGPGRSKFLSIDVEAVRPEISQDHENDGEQNSPKEKGKACRKDDCEKTASKGPIQVGNDPRVWLKPKASAVVGSSNGILVDGQVQISSQSQPLGHTKVTTFALEM